MPHKRITASALPTLETLAGQTLENAKRVAEPFMNDHRHWPSYDVDLTIEGLLALYLASGESQYLDHVINIWGFRGDELIRNINWKLIFTNAHYDTWLVTQDKRFIESQHNAALEFHKNATLNAEGAVHMPQYPGIFIDMICGYAMYLSRAGALAQDEVLLNACVDQLQRYRDILRDPQTGLWHHGKGWFKAGELDPTGWCRGQAWVLRGMVEALCVFPQSHPQRPTLLKLLKEFVADIMRYQDSAGMWTQLMQEPDSFQETTGTGMFVYYLYKAIFKDLIDEHYLDNAERGAYALQFFINEDGTVQNGCQGTAPLKDLAAYRNCKTDQSHTKGTVILGLSALALAQQGRD